MATPAEADDGASTGAAATTLPTSASRIVSAAAVAVWVPTAEDHWAASARVRRARSSAALAAASASTASASFATATARAARASASAAAISSSVAARLDSET